MIKLSMSLQKALQDQSLEAMSAFLFGNVMIAPGTRSIIGYDVCDNPFYSEPHLFDGDWAKPKLATIERTGDKLEFHTIAEPAIWYSEIDGLWTDILILDRSGRRILWTDIAPQKIYNNCPINISEITVTLEENE